MAAMSPITVPCPACAEPIVIPVGLALADRQVDGTAEAVASLDETAIREHVAQHIADPVWACGIVPVTHLLGCSFGGCKAPVQFLSIVSPDCIVSLCRDHGMAALEAKFGVPVEFAEPLGHISPNDPEPTA